MLANVNEIERQTQDDSLELAIRHRAWELLLPTINEKQWPECMQDTAWYYLFVLVVPAHEDPTAARMEICKLENMMNRVERSCFNRKKTRLGRLVRHKLVAASFEMRGEISPRRFPFMRLKWYYPLLDIVKKEYRLKQ